MEVGKTTINAQYIPPVFMYEGTGYVPAAGAAKYLGVSYHTVLNLINSYKRYLVGEKIESTLYVTADSLEAGKARRSSRVASRRRVVQ